MRNILFVFCILALLVPLVLVNQKINYYSLNSNGSCEISESLISLNRIEKLLTRKVSAITDNGVTTVRVSQYFGLREIEIQTEGCGKGNTINRKRGD